MLFSINELIDLVQITTNVHTGMIEVINLVQCNKHLYSI